MMGPRQVAQGALFYEFSIEDHVPADHLLRRIDRFVDLSGVRGSWRRTTARRDGAALDRSGADDPDADRRLLLRHSVGAAPLRRGPSEPRVPVVLSARSGRSGAGPLHLLQEPPGRFRESDLFRQLFEEVLARCIAEGLVGGEAFGVDASLIKADASRYTKVEAAEWTVPETVTRATQEYLDTLDDAAFGGATPVQPRTLSPSDPAARLTGANGDRAFFAYSTNCLVDLESVGKRPVLPL